MSKRTNKKQWAFLIVWFIAYIATLEFFRFKFGLFQITGFFLVIGLLLTRLFENKQNPH